MRIIPNLNKMINIYKETEEIHDRLRILMDKEMKAIPKGKEFNHQRRIIGHFNVEAHIAQRRNINRRMEAESSIQWLLWVAAQSPSLWERGEC